MKNVQKFAMAVMMFAAVSAWAQGPIQQGDQPGQPGQPGQSGQPGQHGPMGQGGHGHQQGGDPMMQGFFPPELIMQNQQALGLSDAQKTSIREIMQNLTGKFTDLQWRMSEEQEKMAALLKQERIDEAKALAQLDKVMGIESEVKKLHLGAMIKIKNVLSTEQQNKLRDLAPSPSRREGGRMEQDGQPRPRAEPPAGVEDKR